MRLAYRQLREAIVAIRRELGDAGDPTEVAGVAGAADPVRASEVAGGSSEPATADAFDVADVRHRLAWILSGLRQQRARESDLIYEAYFDAFRADLTAEHDPGSGS